MKILSINPNDGLKHCMPGTIPRLSVCLGEAEINGIHGAILKPRVGTLLIFQAGENRLSVSQLRAEKAFEVFAIEEALKIQNRFFHAIFGEAKP